MSKPTLLILAAGIGSRYGGLKQIDPIGPNGEIILDYSIFDALRAGFGRVVLIVRPELEQPMREHFTQTLGENVDLSFVYQKMDDLPPGFTVPADRKKPWGTAHAVWSARNEVKEDFGVVNADDFYGPDSYRVLFESLRDRDPGDSSLIGFMLSKTLSEHGAVSRGICRVDSDGFLMEVVERTKIEMNGAGAARCELPDGSWSSLAGDSVASMNMWGFGAEIMKDLGRLFTDFLSANVDNPKAEFYIPTMVDILIKEGKSKCRVMETQEQWFGMTYPEDRDSVVANIRALAESGKYPASLSLGI